MSRNISFARKLSQQIQTVYEQQYDYASVQVMLPKDVSTNVINYANWIPDEAFENTNGRETNPHITVLYGLLNPTVEEVRKVFSTIPPIKAVLGKVTSFTVDTNDTEIKQSVLKIDVISRDLHFAYAALKQEIPSADLHPVYRPHVTIGYLLPNFVAEYVGSVNFFGVKLEFNEVMLSDKDGNLTSIPLSYGNK